MADRILFQLTMRLHIRRLLLGAGTVYFLYFIKESLYFEPQSRELLLHNATQPQWLTGIPRPSQVVDGIILPAADIASYLDAIFDDSLTNLPSFQCPEINNSRYAPLKVENSLHYSIQYFFALNLRQCLPLLPRLIGSVIAVVRFLGPEYCEVSIVEGNSDDGTRDVLTALRQALERLGTTYSIQTSDIDPSQSHRIHRLAELRNMALQPLFHHPSRFSKDTNVIFLNDVAACPEDILELVLQRKSLGADMTCALDWTYVVDPPLFYDVWVARGINGDTFFDVPLNGSWDFAPFLFWNDPASSLLLDNFQPFQVFSCWNGAVVFGAQPVLDNLRFRAADEAAGECFQGEPQLFCKDLWVRGHGRIAVIPTVNLAYSVEDGKRIKHWKGFVSDLITSPPMETMDGIRWQTNPPSQVKCAPTWESQSWLPWNEAGKH